MKTLLHIAVRFFVVLLLLNTSLFSENNFNQEITTLAQTEEWHRLLHFKDNESEIDDPKFFFAEDGKTNPASELQATIKRLISDKSDDENSTLCYYPSRSYWILEKIPQLNEKIYHPKCKGLEKELKELGAKYITVILASAHINSPASAFGHTFLRIDNNPKTPLLSYSVNYAAQTTEENGLIYAYQGIFGGYEGRYTVAPYYEKLKTYSNLEQRDIWEYRLKLNQEEIERMVRHIFEIRHFYADYLFLAENCSYNLLWLIDIAKNRDSINLTKQFHYKAIPIDTIRAILDANLVDKVTYRPSKRKKILALSEPIKNNATALNFAKSSEYNLTQISSLSKEEKRASLELATALLQIKYAESEISKKVYLPTFLTLLKARSRLGKSTHREIPEPIAPSKSHKTAKTSLSYGTQEEIRAKIKFSYHDIYDNDAGFVPGAYIDFLDTTVTYKDEKLTLDELNLLNIRSYAIQDSIFKPMSWEVSLGGKRIFDNELNGYVKSGVGVTVGDEKLYGYTTITPSLYFRDHADYSLSANVGLLYNPSPTFKLGVTASDEWFNKHREIKRVEPFITYSIDQSSALNLKYEHEDIEGEKQDNLQLSWFWYF